MKTYNNTSWTLAEIDEYLGQHEPNLLVKSNWRGRMVRLYPLTDGKILSVGDLFDGSARVISIDDAEDWSYQYSAAVNGFVETH